MGGKTTVDRSRKSSVLQVAVWRWGCGQCSHPLSQWVNPAVLYLCLPPPLSLHISIALMSHYTVRGSTHPLTRGKEAGRNSEEWCQYCRAKKDPVKLNTGDSRENLVMDNILCLNFISREWNSVYYFERRKVIHQSISTDVEEALPYL